MKTIKFDICYKNCSVLGVVRHNETEDEMKRVTIQIVIAGISALFLSIVAVISKPQHATVDAGKNDVMVSVQYPQASAFPGSSLFYAER